MSINLHCKEVKLWQTPTWVTYIIESKGDGGWRGILRRYKIWIESHSQGTWNSAEELRLQEELIADHLDQIDKAVKRKKELHFLLCSGNLDALVKFD
mgnify:CR=1 FL=1